MDNDKSKKISFLIDESDEGTEHIKQIKEISVNPNQEDDLVTESLLTPEVIETQEKIIESIEESPVVPSVLDLGALSQDKVVTEDFKSTYIPTENLSQEIQADSTPQFLQKELSSDRKIEHQSIPPQQEIPLQTVNQINKVNEIPNPNLAPEPQPNRDISLPNVVYVEREVEKKPRGCGCIGSIFGKLFNFIGCLLFMISIVILATVYLVNTI